MLAVPQLFFLIFFFFQLLFLPVRLLPVLLDMLTVPLVVNPVEYFDKQNTQCLPPLCMVRLWLVLCLLMQMLELKNSLITFLAF